jgi:hypothetical protein
VEGKPFPQHGTLGEAQWLEVDIAAGSIASTPLTWRSYMRMLLNRGALPKGRLVSEASFDLFLKPGSIRRIGANPRLMVYGFG